MIKYIIKLLWGSNCNHSWLMIKKNENDYNTRFLFKCENCGDFKKVSL